jgi:hypothetical protein
MEKISFGTEMESHKIFISNIIPAFLQAGVNIPF